MIMVPVVAANLSQLMRKWRKDFKEDGLVGILPLQVKWVTRDEQREYLHNPYDPRDGNDPWPRNDEDARGFNAWG